MSNYPQSPNDPYVNAQMVEPRGMSSGTKVLLTLVTIALVALLLCCGGGVAVVYMGARHFQKAVSEDPVVIAQRRAEMLDIEIPESFKPEGSIDMTVPFIGRRVMTIVSYRGKSPNDSIALAEMGDMLANMPEQDMEQQIKDSLRQQGYNQYEPGIEWEVKEKEFTIGGKPTTFIYRMARNLNDAPKREDETEAGTTQEGAPQEGGAAPEEEAVSEETTAPEEGSAQEKAGEPVRFHVSGTVRGKRGLVFVVITADAETLNEAQIDGIIESIQ